MPLRFSRFLVLAAVAAIGVAPFAAGEWNRESLDRGVVAITREDGRAHVSWRLLAEDPESIGFNVYRIFGDGRRVRANASPLRETTSMVDAAVDGVAGYAVAATDGREERAAEEASLLSTPYWEIPLQRPADGVVRGERYSYSANDASVGDLDGDGDYEIVLKWEPSNAKRPPQPGYTGNCLLDAYTLEGELLWRIDLGRNVRTGAAYNYFLVADFDGDGRAEVLCRTADGTVDGTGRTLGDPEADWRNHDPDTGRRFGKTLTGPEYVTVFEGATGRALDSAEYVPTRYPLDGWGGIGGNGGNDDNGSRSDRFSGGVAYLDGELPSAAMVRGWYGRTVVAAWDFRDGKLSHRWTFDSALPQWEGYSGMGNHSVTVADFDGDGRDEVCVGAMTVDDDGTGLYTTGLRHGDALHAGDLIPERPGLEVYGIHENEDWTVRLQTPGAALFDGGTGEVIWGVNPGVDVGRGVAADIDPNFPGAECWGSPGGTRRADTGEVIYEAVPDSANFAIWWDADPLRELLDRTRISKWDWEARRSVSLLEAEGVRSNNGSKATPCLSGDVLGDWREEVMWRTADDAALRIYVTPIPAVDRRVTLMHDRQYRLAIAWQNVAYNQPPHPSFAME